MIYFKEGQEISSVAVSSIMGHGGDGIWGLKVTDPGYRAFCEKVLETETTVFPKSGTFLSWQGVWKNFDPRTWKCVQNFKDDSMLNNYGLTNKGAKVNSKKIGSSVRKGYHVIPNIYPQFFRGLEVAIQQTIFNIAFYWEALGESFWAIELSVSCNNTKKKIGKNMNEVLALGKAVKAAFPWLKVIYKTNHDHPYELSQELEIQKLADIIHAINSVRYEKVYGTPYSSPLFGMKGVNGGGSVSGGEIFDEFSFPYTKGLRQAIRLPIAMGGGITSLDRAKKCINECVDLSTDSLVICTWPRRDPVGATDLLDKSWRCVLEC